MSTTTEELPKTAASAVNEAARITRDAARQGSETARASMDATRSYLDEAGSLTRDLYGSWAAEGEAILKAAFDAQNGALDVSFALYDLGTSSNRQLMEQYSRLLRQSQLTALESWQAAIAAVSHTFEAPLR